MHYNVPTVTETFCQPGDAGRGREGEEGAASYREGSDSCLYFLARIRLMEDQKILVDSNRLVCDW